MDLSSLSGYVSTFLKVLKDYIPTLIVSIVIFIVGWWLIKLISKALDRVFEKRELDVSLRHFLVSLTKGLLKVILFIVVITQLGIETTSFIAILGAAGLAVGLALQGSLSNFAGGVILLILRPFRVGDWVETQNIAGTVKEIQLFYTKITTATNQLAIIPNALVSNGSVTNYSVLGTRKDFLTFGVAYNSDLKKAKEIILEVMNENDKVLSDPAPEVYVSSLDDSSVGLSARLWAKNEDFWSCHFSTIENVKFKLEEAGIELPFPQRDVHMIKEDKA